MFKTTKQKQANKMERKNMERPTGPLTQTKNSKTNNERGKMDTERTISKDKMAYSIVIDFEKKRKRGKERRETN